MLQRRTFCRFCGCLGVHRYGIDRNRRQRWKCSHCGKVFTRRTNTCKSGSRLSGHEWKLATELFASRGGMSGADLGRILGYGRRTGQHLNRTFRAAVTRIAPVNLIGATEWDESTALKHQWVLGGVSRITRQCLLRCIDDRSERTLIPIVEKHTDGDSPIMTDEWLGYSNLLNHWSVCHAREFVRKEARFVHTNTQEGIWGHLKPMGWHLYRGFPRNTLPSFLAEFMFRYNVKSYAIRVSVLSALLTRPKTNSLVV
jgi:transposase-like protein